ncbi:MAG: gliding motility-associated C-terminal domain-containing protein, partial [Bacteroidales bacterium]
VFTPNGDGKNDVFRILELGYANDPRVDFIDHAELIIVNRYGTEVYSTKDYNNDWDGKGLPDGSYFYKLTVYFKEEFGGGSDKRTGSVNIRRASWEKW